MTCGRAANSTLTYVYADSTAVLGPLSSALDPHGYDLCEIHAARLTAPLGWELVRIEPDPEALKPSSDDLEALANAVREVARATAPAQDDSIARRSHLRSVPAVND